MFFSEEKNQKTFTSCACAAIVAPAQEVKVFCFFFSKKKFFFLAL
jgi:hypothetical protein